MSTPTQKESERHEIESKPPKVESILWGADHCDPLNVRASELLSVATQNVVDAHDTASTEDGKCQNAGFDQVVPLVVKMKL